MTNTGGRLGARSVITRGIVSILLALPLLAHTSICAAETDAYVREATSNVPFLVVGSFQSYAGATRQVDFIHARTGLPIDLRNLDFAKGVLTLGEDECERNGTAGAGLECWVPRGRDSGEVALSIERSDWYPPMKPGYYVVIAVVGGWEEIAEARRILNPAGVTGFVTTIPTYFGCSR
jgi:hypothetical protein